MNDTVTELPKHQTPQTVKAAIMPVPLLQQVTDLIRDLPHRQADPILQQLAAITITDVTLGRSE